MDEFQNEEIKNEEVEQTAEQTACDKPPLDMAEDYINWGELEKAQEILNTVKENSGKKYFLQSLIYKQKCWYNEQRKALKAAIKLEPDNAEYRSEMDALKEFAKTPEYKSAVRHKQMGDAGGVCAEGCTEACCLCTAEGLCSAICDGCG